ncbi:MAG TPA: hypothetical protein VJT73_04070 [Polyangiaceae bacterium]|nr:hypothetical protein [Polyangiaceae bacterium]
MFDRAAAHQVATPLNEAGFLKILFQLLALGGPVLFVYFGLQGITMKRTLFSVVARVESAAGSLVSGRFAGALGAVYLFAAPPLLVSMGPIALAMVGIW